MDYGKIAEILSVIYNDGSDLEGMDFLPKDYWLECDESLVLSTFVAAGLANLTDEGEEALEYAWRILCEVRGLDPEIMYDTPLAFFEAQAAIAEVVPIERGKRNGK